ncbi:hypothetical protein E8L99_13170 [Phreatobacter aquaticus]|uniref:Host specificity protein n=1 Tax=Phreatobacter aquaticus TaxID=2570229 RepID=A0A4D7QJ18_9HYPH|nr:glycoside hydrolase/phage tail family protein [Phreatobacter aquaticus]QCK86641.1 hypothetical protein E8L99_13170 [Phreatobacter aquaticus]
MAALVLSVAGSAIGSSFGAAGAIAGRLIGAVAGAVIDRALFGPRAPDGPRLADLDVLSSTEGTPIPRVYGRMRLAGQVIWATRLEEQVSGGKGSSSGRSYSYSANIAVGLCEGPIAGIGRIWADGKELDQKDLTIRVHRGTETQDADPLIVAKEGAGETPAYRGLAYVVFERLVLDDFGNRIPQLSFEVVKAVGRLETMVRSVVVIPGSTEFGYEPDIHSREFGYGRSAPETRHTTLASSDFSASMDELQALCPNLEAVSLVVSWFGDDLRAGHCTIRPKVERRDKAVRDLVWSAAGLTRESAEIVSMIDDVPAYGGSPSDQTIIRAIQDLTARGLKVTLVPFVMMDIPAENDLADPHSGAASQPAFPWRGRITCDPAPGRPGSQDGSNDAVAEIADFVGTASAAHFSVTGPVVGYLGPDEWRYRRFVMHMAALAKAAGGVDRFIIGSEMIGLTRVRSDVGHPFVEALVAIAADVKVLLPEADLTYAADWTEYGAQVRGADVDFPLDPLWASDDIAAVGIDWYAPLADRRDTSDGSPYDILSLRDGLRSGEAFDWYYASDAARIAGTRTAITDGLGKPWTFRQKDIWSWWANDHRPRIAGVEAAPTGWVPGSKPIWLTECGFPAVDKGANRPSVFPDPKSSESGLPPFSAGTRDDLIQRRALEAVLGRFDPAFGADDADNPVSPVYGGRMVDPATLSLWTWDARPWPAFPADDEAWADGANWETGHWLNGRLGSAPVSDLARAILADYGIEDVLADGVEGVLDGAVIERPMSARDALEPIARAFSLDLVERGATLVLSTPAAPAILALTGDDLVEAEGQAQATITRTEESALPLELSLAFAETEADFRTSAVSSRRLAGSSHRVSSLALAAAADPAEMTVRAETLLQRLWTAQDRATFTLPPSLIRLEPGDQLALTLGDREHRFALTALEGTGMRQAEAISTAPLVRPRRPPSARRPYASMTGDGRPAVEILDLPPLDDADPPVLQHLAAAADPWRGPYTVWRGGDGLGDEAIGTLTKPSLMGETLDALERGAPWLWDRGASVTVQLVAGSLSSLPEPQVLGGGNSCAIRGPGGTWELLQFRDADLIAERTWRLSHLLRGQRGTEDRIQPVAAGAPIVFLSGPLVALGTSLDHVGRSWRYRVGSSVLLAADPAVAEVTATMGLTALRPFSPVQLAARREAGGIRIAWTRRTRIGGDSWDLAEVPLVEAAERYRIAVLDGADAELRAVETTEPAWLYAAADEVSDFGAPVSALTVRVAQLSTLAGPGTSTEAALSV